MRILAVLLASASLAGCAVGPDYIRPNVALTPAFMGAPAIAAEPTDSAWWQGFNDPVLSALVAKAVAGNLDIAAAAARIDQSRAIARSAGADLLPRIDGAGDVTRVSQSRDTPIGRISQAFGAPRGYTQYSAGVQASWEIDVFGGNRRRREAARDALASQVADAGAVRVAVAAETADAYLSLRALQARLDVASRQERIELQLVDVVKQRVGQGIAADRELNRSQGELEGVRASLAPLRAGIAAQLNRLDVLVGEQPGANRPILQQAQVIPTAPMPSGSAAPTDLLRRRPDVVAAERRLAAANAQIGVAVSEYYPHISLSGLLGVASLGTSNLLSGGAVQGSGGAGLRWRLFDFGRIDAEVSQARGGRAEALASWRKSVLTAAEDVETALSRLEEARSESVALDRQVAALTKARGQADLAYRGGVVAIIDVLDADRQLLAASDRQATVKAEQARAAVAAYRALGGGWQSDAVVAHQPASGKRNG
ncbi:efflux transporter outer membrane subunit [Sphingomonas glacialis]|uniref:Efflux transporter outer membrane subunit n=1 Tax=Sphingomonas glacialis TaxID=658225 RepID=A0A502FRK7_9SPHN|nr:efflux transporter outer membrane subunit [Sphingomonas glacialis]TPG52095.1 efflux transporter outer membrane subunit [Sphingomonas glacialis]